MRVYLDGQNAETVLAEIIVEARTRKGYQTNKLYWRGIHIDTDSQGAVCAIIDDYDLEEQLELLPEDVVTGCSIRDEVADGVQRLCGIYEYQSAKGKVDAQPKGYVVEIKIGSALDIRELYRLIRQGNILPKVPFGKPQLGEGMSVHIVVQDGEQTWSLLQTDETYLMYLKDAIRSGLDPALAANYMMWLMTRVAGQQEIDWSPWHIGWKNRFGTPMPHSGWVTCAHCFGDQEKVEGCQNCGGRGAVEIVSRPHPVGHQPKDNKA